MLDWINPLVSSSNWIKAPKFLIDITFTYDRDIVKILKDLEKIAQIDKKYNEGKHVFFALEEKNLITIYKALKPLNFEFSEDFLELV